MLDHNFLPDGLAGWLAGCYHTQSEGKGEGEERSGEAANELDEGRSDSQRTYRNTHNRANEW